MATTESNITKRIQAAATEIGGRLFRNPVGNGWHGEIVYHDRTTGDMVLKNARQVKYGLATGSGDTIGFYPITITAEMVGATVAVFMSDEQKTVKGKPSKAQLQWRDFVRSQGGIANISRSAPEFISGVAAYLAELNDGG